MLFADLLARSAQRVLPKARAKGLVYYFDCTGPSVRVRVSNVALQRALHRMLLGIVDVLDSGFVMMTAEVIGLERDEVEITLHAAGSGAVGSNAAVDQVLRRLQLQEQPGVGARRAGMRRATGICPATHADVVFTQTPGEGAAFSWRLCTRAQAEPVSGAPADAHGSDAWLVTDDALALGSVRRRLSHLGWATTVIATVSEARAQFEQALSEGRAPFLLVAAESDGDEFEFLEEADRRSPSTWAVLAVLEGSAAIERRSSLAVDIRLLPFSPTELDDFTRHAVLHGSASAASVESPVPSYTGEQCRVLVVDDDPLNLVVAKALLELLGYEVGLAMDGPSALIQCVSEPPDIVLMDVDMPGIDGIETARRMRLMQAEGEARPFPIIVATALDFCDVQERLLSVATDGYVRKPFLFPVVEGHLRRLLPAQPSRRLELHA